MYIHKSAAEEGKFDPPCFTFCQWLHDGCEQEPDQYSLCKKYVAEGLEEFEKMR